MTTEETAVATQDPKQVQLANWLEEHAENIALPRNIDVARLAFSMRLSLMKTPALRGCTMESLLNSMLQIASVGLYPGPLAHLIPYRNREKGTVECRFVIDYKGLMEVIVAGTEAVNIEAEVVRDGDDFSYQKGTSPFINHVPLQGMRSNRAWTHVYAIIFYANGITRFEVMDHAEVYEVKARVAQRGKSPWDTDEVEMAKKTVIRRLAKTTPKQTLELQNALEFEDRMDAGLPAPFSQPVAQIAPVPEDLETHTLTPEEQAELDNLYDGGQGAPPEERGAVEPSRPASRRPRASQPAEEPAAESEAPPAGSEEDDPSQMTEAEFWEAAKEMGYKTTDVPKALSVKDMDEWLKTQTYGAAVEELRQLAG